MYAGQFSNLVVSIIMLVSGYNNIILLPNCTLLYYNAVYTRIITRDIRLHGD